MPSMNQKPFFRMLIALLRESCNLVQIFEKPFCQICGKPPQSSTTMSINFDSPRKGQVPNLIQFYSWDAVTAHNKRARIHIWRKKSRKILRWNFVNFVGHGRPGKAFLHPTAPSGKGLSLLAINRELSEKYILFIF